MDEQLTPSPRRQRGQRPHPLALEPPAAEAAGLSPPVKAEFVSTLQQEAEAFRRTGRIYTPRKEIAPQPPPSRDSCGDVVVAAAARPSAGPSHVPRYFPRLRRLFECFGQSDVHPRRHLALAALQQIVVELDPSVRWEMERPLQRAVRLRVEAQEREFDERTRRARELREEQQRAAADPRAEFMREYNAARDELRLGAATDQYVLTDLERRAAREEARRARQAEEAAAVGRQRLEEARAARERRHLERERRIAELRDREEEARDDVDAVRRVRIQLEREKRETAADS